MDGRLQIIWEECKIQDFESYNVYKEPRPPDNHRYESILLATITDPTTTEYIDSSYVGCFATYRIDIGTGSTSVCRGDSLTYYSPGPVIQSCSFDGNETYLRWNKTPFYRNFGAYQITSSVDMLGERTVGKVLNPEVTTFIDSEVPLSRNVQYSVKTLSRDSTAVWSSDENSAHVSTMQQFIMFSKIYYNPTNKVYYLIRTIQDTLTCNNIWTMKDPFKTTYAVRDYNTEFIPFHVSSSGQHVYSASDNGVERLDPVYLTPTETYATVSLIGRQGYPAKLSVSGDNKLAFITAPSESYPMNIDSTYLVDMTTGQLLGRLGCDSFWSNMFLDDTGNYLANNSTLYRIQNDEITKVGKINRGRFWVNNGETYWVEQTDSELIINHCPDLTPVVTIEVGASRVFDWTIDQLNDLIACRTGIQSEEYRIFDLNTGVLVENKLIGLFTEYRLVLLNSWIFHGEGLRFPLTL